MAHTVTHAKVSTVSDSGNASLVQPSDWNAAHTVTVDASLVDHGSLAGLSDDDHTSYHTDARALTWLGTRSTTDLPEGTNEYYTQAKADARVAVHTGDTTDAHAASAITNTPAGGIAATTVQAALNELDGDKQPLDAGLTDIAALAVTDGNFIVGNGTNWVAESGATALASIGGAAASHTHSLADITDEGALASLSTVGTSQIDNDAVTYAKIQNVSATDRLLGRDTASAGDVEELTVGGGIEFTGTGGIQTSAFTGDVTKSAGGTATTIANDAVTNAKLANMAANTIKGRVTGSTGDPEDLTAANVATIISGQFGAAKASFFATKGGTDQTTISDVTPTQVTFGTEVFDVGGYFASSAWTPPAGKVLLCARMTSVGTITAGSFGVIYIFKNGSGYRAGYLIQGTNFGVGEVVAIDDANGTDVYTIYAYIDVTSGTATVEGDTDRTYFLGTMI